MPIADPVGRGRSAPDVRVHDRSYDSSSPDDPFRFPVWAEVVVYAVIGASRCARDAFPAIEMTVQGGRVRARRGCGDGE